MTTRPQLVPAKLGHWEQASKNVLIENAKTLPSLAKPHSTLEHKKEGRRELNLEKRRRTSWKLEVTDGKNGRSSLSPFPRLCLVLFSQLSFTFRSAEGLYSTTA